jgi:hypothetical protein
MLSSSSFNYDLAQAQASQGTLILLGEGAKRKAIRGKGFVFDYVSKAG